MFPISMIGSSSMLTGLPIKLHVYLRHSPYNLGKTHIQSFVFLLVMFNTYELQTNMLCAS